MLYLIGLGLNEKGISLEGIENAKKCKKIYLENYTVNFPYDKKDLEKLFGKKIESASRDFVESEKIVSESKKNDVALLVYGDPLIATTHISLFQSTKEKKIKCKIIHAASILDAISETGLQLYKFGKTTSMPTWNKEKHFMPESFIEVVDDNLSIGAHTIILIDIGLKFKDALEQLSITLKKNEMEIEKVIVCSQLGTSKRKIIYNSIEKLKKEKIDWPYCLIIPGKLHFVEEDVLNGL